jgi:4-hydroxybenzoate polyprenyltransferase
MRHLLPYAQLVRLPNTFTAMADIFLGALATGFFLQRWYVLLCLLCASTMLYWSGMIWNDYFDLDQDRKERPGRPLASEQVSLRTAVMLASGLMVGGLLMAFLAGFRIERDAWIVRWTPLVVAALLVLAIFLYDGVFKATFAGPILMGLCRSLNILLGLSILLDTSHPLIPFWGWLIALIIGVYIGGVTWFARTEARVSSQPMLIGAAIAMLLSLVLALAVPALALQAADDYSPSNLFPYLLALFGCYLGVAVIAAIRRPDANHVQPVIKRAILGLVVLDALFASAFVGNVGLLLVVLLIPGLFLGRWLYST